MFFTDTISTDTPFGQWCVYGRWIFIALFSIIIFLLICFLIKKKIKIAVGIIAIACCAGLAVLMFVTGFKTSVFVPDEIVNFFNELDNMLTVENLSVSESTDEQLVWSWYNENDKIAYTVTVKDHPDGYNLSGKPSEDKQIISGKIDDYRYSFTPMMPQFFNEYCVLARYYGKLYLQSDEYYIEVVYKMTGSDAIDYISVIYPFLYTKEISLMELLEKSDEMIIF